MAATLIDGQTTWSGSRDDEGHREYKITHLVKHDFLDGPKTIMDCPGLPVPGSIWNFDNDIDIWAFCYPSMIVRPHKQKDGEKFRYSTVEQKFSTKPMKRCSDTSIEDPLLEPDRISGSFVKYTQEALYDRFGERIKSSSHEQFRGPQVEFDANRPAVKIEQNVSDLELALFSELIDHVNDAPLWGLPARCVKLDDAPWEKKLYGSCSVYYTRSLSFSIMFETFDRDLLDEGTKVLHGHWNTTTGEWDLDNINGAAPDPNNPQHFDRYKDKNGENARVILDGTGKPAKLDLGTGTGEVGGPGSIHVEKYFESNLLLLGIPAVLV